MAYGILSEDMLAICLFFAGGDVMMPMGEIVCRVEEFQRGRGDFGVSDTDFRWAFMRLAEAASGGKKTSRDIWGTSEDPREIFSGLLLRDFIKLVLRYSGIWFNDEGEHWESADEYPPSPHNLRMRQFFFGSEDRTPELVTAFLYANGWDEELLNDARMPHRYHRYDDRVFGELPPPDKEMKDFLDFLDSPFYKEMLASRKEEPERKQYRPYR